MRSRGPWLRENPRIDRTLRVAGGAARQSIAGRILAVTFTEKAATEIKHLCLIDRVIATEARALR